MRMLAIWLIAAAVPLCAQDWTPKRIVAITDYVPLARQARISGDVEVRCLLDANGAVTRAEAITGHPLLKDQARRNALLWKFQRSGPPGENNTVILKYQYRLQGDLQDRARTVFLVDLPNTIQIVGPVAVPEINY
jgi:outer membrane biosynthesis protein TonB